MKRRLRRTNDPSGARNTITQHMDRQFTPVTDRTFRRDLVAEILAKHGEHLTLNETIACYWVMTFGFQDDGLEMKTGVNY